MGVFSSMSDGVLGFGLRNWVFCIGCILHMCWVCEAGKKGFVHKSFNRS